MPYGRQVIVARNVAVLGGVVVARHQARRQGVLGAHGVSVMGQSSRLLIGTTVSLRFQVSLPLAVQELRRLPGGSS